MSFCRFQAFLADFEGPPNVAVTIPCDAAPPLVTGRDSEDENSQDEADTVRIHNRMGGFKFVFLAILIVAALTSGFCFYRAVSYHFFNVLLQSENISRFNFYGILTFLDLKNPLEDLNFTSLPNSKFYVTFSLMRPLVSALDLI